MSTRSFALALPFVAGLSCFAVGCGPADVAALDAVASSEEAIKNGYTDTDDVNVVGIYDMSSSGLCTGSLIAPNLVLTARHCVAPVLNEVDGGVSCQVTKFGANHKASAFYVTTKKELSGNFKDYHVVKSVESPPIGDTAVFCGNDVAALILTKPIDGAEAKPLVPRVDGSLLAKDEYYAVGYGATDGAGNGAGTRRRRDGLFVECVGEGCKMYVPKYLRKTEFVGDEGTCQGDSGGPAFDMAGRVVGITSRGGGDCEMSIYTQVYGWSDWIKELGVKAAEAGGYEPPPWATGWPTDPAFSGQPGATCATDKECPAGKCVLSDAGGYCTRKCSDAAPCPEGYQCDAGAGGVCIAIPAPDQGAGGGGVGGGAATSTASTKKKAAPQVYEVSDCAVHSPGADPTKPDPWFAGAAVSALALYARRR